MADDRGSLTIRKSGVRQGGELGCGCVASIAFLGAGIAFAGDSIFALLGFGFWAAFLGVATIAEGLRGTDTRLIEVDRDGIWLPEVELLPWSAITEVRLESVRGLVGGDEPITRRYRRLGVVPRDPDLRPRAATRLTGVFLAGYQALLNRIGPGIRLGGEDLARFGVSEAEMSGGFDQLLEVTARYVEIVDADARRAREHAPRWRSGAAGTPSATFVIPPIRPGDIVGPVVTAIGPVLLLASWVAASGGIVEGPARPVVVLVLAIVIVPFVIPGARRLVRLRRLQRRRAVEPRLFAVGPDGAWLPRMGLAPWTSIAEVRTERAGMTTAGGGPPIERWRLVFLPALGSGLGGPYGIDSDALDAPFDDVVDLVRNYHPVVETG